VKGEISTVAEPFVMYIFEFKEELKQIDLADIWQGLMPECAKKAKLDTQSIEHPLDVFNFFEGKKIPATLDPLAESYDPTDTSNDVRWIVFKVKRKDEKDYNETTPIDDTPNAHSIPEHSYNWPYDYFSLVEMTRVKGGIRIDTDRIAPELDGKELSHKSSKSESLTCEKPQTQPQLSTIPSPGDSPLEIKGDKK
jgi:hypothetical protein